jgi:hypothetical protein
MSRYATLHSLTAGRSLKQTNLVEGKLDCQDKLWAAVVVLKAQTSRVLRQLGTSLTVFAKKNGK